MVNIFDVAAAGDDEQRLVKQAATDKLNEAVYDVRTKFGAYLFQADDLDGFNDRAKIAYVDICNTIEPHMHARKGVHRRVMKTLEREWRERRAGKHDDPWGEFGPAINVGYDVKEPPELDHGNTRPSIKRVPTSDSDPWAPHHYEPRHRAAEGQVQDFSNPNSPANALEGHFARLACYPGCHEDEAHADKFHKDKEDKEARRRQAAGGQLAGTGDATNQVPAPLPTNAGGQSMPFPHADSPTPNLPGTEVPVPNVGQDRPGELQSYASYHRAAFEDNQDHPELVVKETYESHTYEPLEPEGDFDSYKDSVDQGAEEKVDHDFVDGGGEVRKHDENGDHNFVPTVTGSRFPEYQRIARMLLADGDPTSAAPAPGAAAPSASPQGFAGTAAPPVDTSVTAAGSGMPVTPPVSPMTASREYQIIARMIRADIPGMAPAPADPVPTTNVGPNIETPGGNVLPGIQSPTQNVMSPMDKAGHKGNRWASKAIVQDGTKGARLRLVAVCESQGVFDIKVARAITALVKVGDRNYLQQADEAITKVLNEKAEEFQNTIAPLQQALQTIQQAEALANPLNVTPPAGTINVMPQQQDPTGGQVPQDPAVDPAAAGLADQQQQPPQQVQARKRGGNSKKA